MKLYLAITPEELIMYEHCRLERVLISYYGLQKKYSKIKDRLEKIDVFLDSGAFSAFNSSANVSLSDYISFLKENKFKTYASLDVIYNPEGTRKNFEIMKNEGLNPIPTFHFGTDIKELDYYTQFPYIALGGLVPYAMKRKKLQNWLDYCFEKLIKKVQNGLKVHAFGVQNVEILKRYPFYSADGTSWKEGPRWGRVNELKGAKVKEVNNAYIDSLRLSRDNIKLGSESVKVYQKLEKFLTDLWAKRGITFND